MNAIQETIYRVRHHEPSGMVAAENLAQLAEKELATLKRAATMLATLIDQVDYTGGACHFTEMVGAVLPTEVLTLAKEALQDVRAAQLPHEPETQQVPLPENSTTDEHQAD
jgi:hypothetical protein